MNKKFNDFYDTDTCPKYGVKVEGYIEYKDSSTNEGIEYSKGSMDCDYKATYHCTRNDCPLWKGALRVIPN